MDILKQSAKKIIPRNIWEFFKTHKALFLDTVLNFGSKICTTKYFGFTIYYNRGNALIDRLRKEKYFEKELCEQIINDLNRAESKRFLDIGANIGLITASVLANVQNVVVDCFEPGPLQSGLLEKTLKENKLSDQATLHHEALGANVGTEKFFVHVGADIAKDGFKNTGRGEGGKEIEVSVTTLDTWWHNAGRPKVSVIKIDTEGAELLILRGGKELLAACKPVVYLEIESTNLASYPYTAKDILEFFATIGYTATTLDGELANIENIGTLMKHSDTYKASFVTL